jgi:hypothetical protein
MGEGPGAPFLWGSSADLAGLDYSPGPRGLTQIMQEPPFSTGLHAGPRCRCAGASPALRASAGIPLGCIDGVRPLARGSSIAPHDAAIRRTPRIEAQWLSVNRGHGCGEPEGAMDTWHAARPLVGSRD